MSRPYIHHTTATLRYLHQHYWRQPMAEIAATLGIPAKKLYGLVYRQGLTKRALAPIPEQNSATT